MLKSKHYKQVVVTYPSHSRRGQLGRVEMGPPTDYVTVHFQDGESLELHSDSVLDLVLPVSYELKATECESPINPELIERLTDRSSYLLDTLRSIHAYLETTLLDQAKKEVFYGREYPYPVPISDYHPVESFDHPGIRLLHGLLGIITEIEEFIPTVISFVNGDRSDEVLTNLLEELGDLRWYFNLCVLACGFNTMQVEQANLKKLMSTRYASGTFTPEEANNRNISAEQQALLDMLDDEDT